MPHPSRPLVMTLGWQRQLCDVPRVHVGCAMRCYSPAARHMVFAQGTCRTLRLPGAMPIHSSTLPLIIVCHARAAKTGMLLGSAAVEDVGHAMRAARAAYGPGGAGEGGWGGAGAAAAGFARQGSLLMGLIGQVRDVFVCCTPVV